MLNTIRQIGGIFIKRYIIILIYIIATNLVGCTTLEKSINDDSLLNSSNEVTICTEEKTYSSENENIKINIENNTSKEFYYGEPYEIEFFENNNWYKIPFKEGMSFTEVGIILGPNQVNNHEISFENLGVNLERGKYRIIKKVGDNLFSTEFKLT